MALRVFYGFAKLTSKAVRKPELAIYFENDNHNPVRNEASIRKILHVVHVRAQSPEEATDAKGSTRVFTKYSYFIDEKPWRGDIEKVLENSSEADKNHVPEKERNEITNRLREAYYRVYERAIVQ